jgi:hypothetical protein
LALLNAHPLIGEATKYFRLGFRLVLKLAFGPTSLSAPQLGRRYPFRRMVFDHSHVSGTSTGSSTESSPSAVVGTYDHRELLSTGLGPCQYPFASHCVCTLSEVTIVRPYTSQIRVESVPKAAIRRYSLTRFRLGRQGTMAAKAKQPAEDQGDKVDNYGGTI